MKYGHSPLGAHSYSEMPDERALSQRFSSQALRCFHQTFSDCHCLSPKRYAPRTHNDLAVSSLGDFPTDAWNLQERSASTLQQLPVLPPPAEVILSALI